MEDSWPADVVEFVQKRQRSAYSKLAEKMGLGHDHPDKAFAALNKGLPPFPERSLLQLTEEASEGRAVTAEEQTQSQQFFKAILRSLRFAKAAYVL